MTDRIEDGGPAFPRADDVANSNSGMTLRDWFAGQSLKWAGHGEWFHHDPESAAMRAYKMADAMLAARKGGAS